MRLLKLLPFLVVCAVNPVVAGPYEDGLAAYTKADYVAALGVLRPAAEAGDPRAQNLVGFLYEQGRGVAQSSATAVSWYHRAADQGFAAAQYNLGVIYERGHGVQRDYAAALSWYRKAADQGFPAALFNLGTMYEAGLGVARDDAEAMEWYRKAADRGLTVAEVRLRALRAKAPLGVPAR
jgi:uncharacterized protein